MPLSAIDLSLLSAVGLSASGLYLLHKKRDQGIAPDEVADAPDAVTPPCPAGHMPVLTASRLFTEVCADPLLVRIRQSLGFAPENFARDATPLLMRVAEFVQLLPASESHHHANPGGLLTHLLEVASVALLQCEAAKLPVGRPTEEQLKHAARWRYGVLVAALLHDIGKPVADVVVSIINKDGASRQWNGLGGSLLDFGHAYIVRFPLQRDYTVHQRLPVILLKTMVPPDTMRWLSDDPELIALLVSYLSGESDGGHVGALVKAADGRSVADNLLNGTRTRFATARQVPLIERLMDALRRMLADGGQLPLNREGAAGFCDGTDIWFVAGTVADRVRVWLDKNETRESGAADLPTDNSRLFDVWYDYGAIVPNHGGAIWKVRITVDKAAGGVWTQTLTCMRFPLRKLFASPDQYPTPLTGHVDVISTSTDEVAPSPTPPQPVVGGTTTVPATDDDSPTDDWPIADMPTAPATLASPDHPDPERPAFELTPVALNMDGDLIDLGPSTPQPAIDVPTAGPTDDDAGFLDTADSALVADLIVPPLATRAAAAQPDAPTMPVAPAQARIPANSVLGDIKQPAPEIERMMAWLQHGISNGTVEFNRNTASVHFVAAGMLLLTPKVFREYMASIDPGINPVTANVKPLQHLLQKSGYVVKQSAKTYLHYYRIENARNPERAMIACYLVPNPRQFFNPVPDPNEHLSPCDQAPGKT
jgi:integrating conjugative element relaxase (TIGR03760 family)